MMNVLYIIVSWIAFKNMDVFHKPQSFKAYKILNWMLLTFLLLLIPLLLLWWFYIPFRYNIHEVVPGKIYRSGQMHQDGLLYMVKNYHIASIVNLRGAHPERQWYQDEIAISKQFDIQHYNVSMPSHHLPSRQELINTTKVIKKVKFPVLFHCRYGVDRAGLASALALLLIEKAPYKEVVRQVSLRYLVLNPYSVGRLVFHYYKQWLNCHHYPSGSATFSKWLKLKNPFKNFKNCGFSLNAFQQPGSKLPPV